MKELINSDFKIEIIVGTEAYFARNLKSLDCRAEVVNEKLLTDIGTFKTNEDAIAVAQVKNFGLHNLSTRDHVFVLDGVSDPGNVGTIIRTLDWFGFNQLVCSNDSAEFYSPKVINSTMGSFTRVRVIHCDLGDFYHQNKLRVFAADMTGTSLKDMEVLESTVFVMGSESHGVSEQTKAHCTSTITIPAFGQAESLNVGVATGIIASQLRIS
ncbi:MAG: RNA methyltransferase [Ekhidna sp.]|nr:RNA methyltransferase [Ekhidna sp.]